MTTATASAKLLDPVIQIARHLQQDPSLLLEAQGIAPERVEQLGARIPAALFARLLDDLARRTANPRIALRIGEATQPRMLGSVGFLISTSARLGDALQQLANYLPLLVEGVHLSIEPRDGGAELRLDLEDDSQRALVEWLLACLHTWPRWLTGRQLPLRSVEFAYPEPAEPQLFEQFFAAEVGFDGARNRLWFDAQHLELPCLDANEELQRHHQSFADQLLSKAGRDGALVARIKSLIRNELEQGRAISRQQAANNLAMSLRTLQRKLDQQQTSFQSLFDSTRHEMALLLMQRDDRSLGEISFQLGFSSLSAFQKAFKRWTGSAPGQWRNDHRPDPLILREQRPRTLTELAQAGVDEAAFYPLALQLLDQLQSSWQKGLPTPALHPAQISVVTDARGHSRIQLQQSALDQLTLPEQLGFEPPEASGLLPYGEDQRSDLFRIGSLFYFLFHGQPLFEGANAAARLHAQRHQSPLLSASLSGPLKQIISRLLARPLEERYQRIGALQTDLKQAQLAFELRQPLAHFKAGAQDHPEFHQPPELFGRQAALARLQSALDATLRQEGSTWLVTGPAGSGRSALIQALRNHCYRSQITLLAIDAANSSPSDVCLQLCRQLLRHKLALPRAQQVITAERIRRRLGRQALAVASLLPELSELLSLQRVQSPSHQQRAPLLQDTLLALLNSHPAPLLLAIDDPALDDRHWQSLIGQLQQITNRQQMLLLSATGEPNTTRWGQLQSLPLTPLPAAAVHAWVDRLFGGLDAERSALADWLHRHSSGLPVAVVHHLERMRRRGWLHFQSPHWQLKASALAQGEDDSELQELLTTTLDNLPAATRQILRWAAVAGDPFNPALIAEARQDPLQRIEIHLWPAQQAGLLRTSQGATASLRFSHPALRRPLLEQLDDNQQADMRWRLGRALQHRWRQHPSSTLLHRCVKQLNAAYRLKPRAALRWPLCRLNHQAALDAQQGGNPTLAQARIEDAVAALQPQDHRQQPNAVAPLLLDACAIALDSGHPQQTAQWLEQAEALLNSRGHRIRHARLNARLLQAQGQPTLAITALCDTLDQLDQPLPLSLSAQLQMLEQPPSAPPADTWPLLQALLQLAEAQLHPGLANGLLLISLPPGLEPQPLREWLLLSRPPHATPEASAAPAHCALSLTLRGFGWCWQRHQLIAALAELATDEPPPQTARDHADWLHFFGGQPLPSHETVGAGPARMALQQALASPSPEADPIEPTDSPWQWAAALTGAWLLDRQTQWPQLLQRAEVMLARFEGLPLQVDLLLFCALIAQQRLPLSRADEQARLQQLLARIEVQFDLWTPLNPSRFEPMALLLATLKDTDSHRRTLGFETLIEQLADSDEQGWYHITLELYAEHCAAMGQQRVAALLAANAADGFDHWGVPARAARLRRWQTTLSSRDRAGTMRPIMTTRYPR